MIKGKRILAWLLLLVVIATMLPAVAQKAQAYTTPGTMTVAELDAKIEKLSTMLEGKYFTTTGYSCGNNACDACKNVNVFEASWFKEMFGTVTGSQIPTHAYPYGVTGTAIGWTCHGFANFAQWYLFATSSTDKVTNYRVVDNVTMTRANMLKYAKPGDIIRYTYNTTYGYGHSVIFISANENNYTVLDNNFAWNGDAKSRVRTHTISYNSSIPMAISRANNYPTGTALTMSYSANGGEVNDTYKIKTATPGTILRLRSSAGLSGTVLASIPDATVLEVLDTATADGYTWAKVNYNGTLGWCAITGLATREGYYLDMGLIYRYSDSKPFTESWSVGVGKGLATPSSLTLSREGYSFLGWSTAPDGSGPLYAAGDTSIKAEDLCPEVELSDQNITLYAIWEDLNPTVLTFAYDGNGGTGSISPVTAKKGNIFYISANQFQKTGDTFMGWYLQRQDGLWYSGSGWDTQQKALLTEGQALMLDDTFVTLEGDHSYTLIAQWKNDTIEGIAVHTAPNRTQYTLNSQFDPSGMTLRVNYQDGSYDVIENGFTVAKCDFSRVGSVQVGVEYCGYTAYTTVQVYEPPVLTVGSVSGYLDEVVAVPVQYSSGTTWSQLSAVLCFDPAQVGCMGYSLPDGVDASTVRVNLAQGKLELIYSAYTSEETLLWVHMQIMDGDQISVWAGDAQCVDGNGDTLEMEAQTGTITNRGLLSVTYDVGAGKNGPAGVQVRFGQQVTVSSVIPTREGYTFVGWSLFESGAVADYYAGNTITCMTDTVLYAVWKKNVTVTVVPTLTLNYPTVSFEDQIQYNVYYTATNTQDVVAMGLVIFDSKLTDGTIADAVDVVGGYVASGSNYMVHTRGIPAKNLGDAMYFKVCAKLSDGSYVYSDVAGYNAVAYAKTVLSSTTASRQAKSLVVAMLNYGAASQVQFGYKTDDLMNSFLTEAGKALAEPYNSTMMSPVVAADSERAGHFVMNKTAFTGAYPTVSFEGAFTVNYYFTAGLTPDSGITFCYWDAEAYETADKLTTANATGISKMVFDGERWYAAVEGIAAKDMDKTIYVAAIYKSGGTTYTTSVISYSLGKYCQTMADAGNDLGAAAAVYGYYAKAYFA